MVGLRTLGVKFCLFAALAAPSAFCSHSAAASPEPPSPASSIFSPVSMLLAMGLQIRQTELDCSHLVHYLYESAGLEYPYTPSRQLYKGTDHFKRVRHPKAGDLVVWNGHVGVVVDPQAHSFLSSLRSGVKVARYDSSYWRKRGIPRFLRYAGEDTRTAELHPQTVEPAE
jgi:cell wall-associated NlpC family hydrolase